MVIYIDSPSPATVLKESSWVVTEYNLDLLVSKVTGYAHHPYVSPKTLSQLTQYIYLDRRPKYPSDKLAISRLPTIPLLFAWSVDYFAFFFNI